MVSLQEVEDLEILEEAIREGWGADTSYFDDYDEWSDKFPSYGQCAVTANIVKQALGHNIFRAEAHVSQNNPMYSNRGGVSHYYNKTDEGEIIDLTEGQFPEAEIVEDERREAETFNEETLERYEILKERVKK